MESIPFRLSRQELKLRLIQDLNHKYPNFPLFKNDSFLFIYNCLYHNFAIKMLI